MNILFTLVLSYTRRVMQNFLSFRDSPIIPLRRSTYFRISAIMPSVRMWNLICVTLHGAVLAPPRRARVISIRSDRAARPRSQMAWNGRPSIVVYPTVPAQGNKINMTEPKNSTDYGGLRIHLLFVVVLVRSSWNLQPADIGWPSGNGKKWSNSQACCVAQLCLAAA